MVFGVRRLHNKGFGFRVRCWRCWASASGSPKMSDAQLWDEFHASIGPGGGWGGGKKKKQRPEAQKEASWELAGDMAMVQNQWDPILGSFLVWIGMFTGGTIWVLTHGHIHEVVSSRV